MRKKTSVRNSFSLRIPPELNQKLREYADKIGVSKTAVILNLIYKELGDERRDKKR